MSKRDQTAPLEALSTEPAFLFDLDGTLVDSAYRVYQDPADLLNHLDEVGVRAAR